MPGVKLIKENNLTMKQFSVVVKCKSDFLPGEALTETCKENNTPYTVRHNCEPNPRNDSLQEN